MSGAHTQKTRLAQAIYNQAKAQGQKRCPGCELVLPMENFPLKGKYRDGRERYGYCKACHSLYQRRKKLESVFGITVDEYNKILAYQGGRCAICPRIPKNVRLGVDHRHKDGMTRGLLCWICNRVVGLLRDNPDTFKRGMDYLLDPPAPRALGRRVFGKKGPSQKRTRKPGTLEWDPNKLMPV